MESKWIPKKIKSENVFEAFLVPNFFDVHCTVYNTGHAVGYKECFNLNYLVQRVHKNLNLPK
jgi:hypothetical protein